ncbi:hypothetical protein EVJ58_g6384 [Rhodofomes roseus]|uniref:MI domain-containing protein n=1 Tax=Rhodofomes roseus TaxID=34475 RepID=A0A4Y9YA95_9APHY|nr:hypothetical protein EVJ58_g6384 [Rhodofomes roseus]
MAPAMPNPGHPPHPAPSPHTHTSSLSSVSSPPPTPSSSGPGNRLNTAAPTFQPRTARVKITSSDGKEVQLDSFKKGTAPLSPAVPASPARKTQVRLEKPEDKEKREAQERAKEEAREKAKREAEEKAKREADEKARKEKEVEEKRKAEEEERVRKEKEKADEDRRRQQEDEEKARKEAEKAKEEEERLRKEEERLKAEEEKVAATGAEPEEGEVDEVEATPASETVEKTADKEDSNDKLQDKGILRIDTAVSDTPKKRHPGPLDLSSTRKPIAQPLPSALATARIIEDLGSVSYPEGIRSPKIELNVNAKHGKFRYDRDFLMQFMKICKDKPDNLPPLDAIGLEPSEQGAGVPMSRGGSQRRSSAAMGPPPPNSARQLQGLGLSNFSGQGGNFTMGKFATQNPKTSEERFKEASMGRSASMTGAPPGVAIPFGARPSPMVRSSSQGGPSAMGSKRTRSKRGVDRGEPSKGGPGPSYGSSSLSQAGMMSLEPVAPLEQSANRWTPASLTKKPQVVTDSPEVVDRKVRGLLNKLTMERFDSISDQIIAWANRSENEHDGRTLIQVIRLVFEKATDEAAWSEMYARLCRKMMEQISPKVQDEGIKNAEGKPIAGGQLFRKYLLNRCQEDFEHGWAAKESAAAAAATKATEDQAAKDAAEKDESGEVALYSEEYYIAQKAKRQGLGLVKFIGELFKLQILTERIMHECVKKLLGTVEKHEKEEIESLCMLLTTVGQLLDTPKARAHMDVYFTRMKELTKNPNVNSRMQFMLVDLIELRERNWVPRNLAAAPTTPTTIAAVHAQGTKETALKPKESGWLFASVTPSRVPPKAGDLNNFGKISKSNSITSGPTGLFTSKDRTKRDSASSLSRGSLAMFSTLIKNPELAVEAAAAQPSRPPSHKDSVDFPSPSALEAPLQRKKLQLLPRPKPKPDERADSTPAQSDAGQSDDEDSAAPSMSEEEAKTRVDEDSKEFFSIRDLNEAEVYFSKLPSEHRWLLVDKLVTSAIESKASDAQLVADFFSGAVSKNLCSPESLEKGFTPTAEILDDIVIDAPKALSLMATMMKGARLDEEPRTRLVSKYMDSEQLTASVSWTTSLSPSSVSTLSPSSSSSFRSAFHDVDMTLGDNAVSTLGIPSLTDNEPSLASTASIPTSASTTRLRPVRDTRAESQSTNGFTRDQDPMLSLQETLSSDMESVAIPEGTIRATAEGSRPSQVLRASESWDAIIGVGLVSPPEVSQLRAHPDVLPKYAARAVQSELQADDQDNEDPGVLSEEKVKVQLTASMQKFFKIRSLAKGEASLRGLPSAHRWRFINKLVSYAVFSGAADSRLVSDLFSCAASKGLCSPDEFDEGFSSTMETLDVLALWLPNALSMIAILLKGTRLNEKQLRRLVHKAASSHSEILLALLL